MPLRLAGEDYAVVQGLDDLGRLRTIAVSDASPGLKVNQVGAGAVLELQAAGAARLTLTNAGRLQLPVQGASGGLLIGADVNLYRGDANVLQTDDSLQVVGGVLFLVDTSTLIIRDGTNVRLINNTALPLVLRQVQSQKIQFDVGNTQRAEFNATTGDLSLGTQKLLFGIFGAEDTNLYRSAANALATDDLLVVGAGGLLRFDPAGFIECNEIGDPAAPAVNAGRLYIKDNGSGKTQLAVRFPTGAVQVLATEP